MYRPRSLSWARRFGERFNFLAGRPTFPFARAFTEARIWSESTEGTVHGFEGLAEHDYFTGDGACGIRHRDIPTEE
jgi:hypothetical protein